MKRFACRDIIPGCDQVFTGEDDQSVLDQVITHAAEDHGLVKPPLALVELVVATTHDFTPPRTRGHLRLVGAEPSDTPDSDAAGAEAPVRDALDRARNTEERGPIGVLKFSRDRSAHGAQAAPGLADVAPLRQAAVHDSYRHESVFYRGVDDFVASTAEFVREGLALDQPVMVAVAEPRLTALRRALGHDADRVQFADMATLGRNPALIIPAWREFTRRAAGQPMRGIGEPIWPQRRDAEIVECQFHEALLNLAVTDTTPLWLLCPYDVTALSDAIVAEARHSHPVLVDSGATTSSPEYGARRHVMELFGAPLPEPTSAVTTLTLPAERLDEIADLVLSRARAAGLRAQRSTKLAAAVDEVVLAGIDASDGDVRVRLWQDGSALVCEVADDGVISDPMVGRSESLSANSRERGIRLANELCDLVQVRSGAAGTAVRVHSWL